MSCALPENVGAQFIAGDARYLFDLHHPIDGDAVPLANCGAGNPQRAGQFSLTASGLNGHFDLLCSHGEGNLNKMFSGVNPDLDSIDMAHSDIPPGMDTPGKRVKWLLEARGRKATWLAEELGVTRSAVSQWWQKVAPTTPGKHIAKIASLLSCSEHWLKTGTGAPFARQEFTTKPPEPSPKPEHRASAEIFTLGEVGAGMFVALSEVSDLNYHREPSTFPPLPDYPIDKQYDLIIRGTSIDRFATEGQRVRCVSIDVIEPKSGDYVHTQRYRHQRSEVENTIKQAFLVNGRWELRFSSMDPRWRGQPPLQLGVGEDEQVEIVGVAIFQFYPSPVRRRTE
jgi:transcriptional regulator with XRE-family HTH domain